MENIKIGKGLWFLEEDSTFSGVKKIAGKVMNDIWRVTDTMPSTILKEELEALSKPVDLVIYGTIGRSAALEELQKSGLIDLNGIEGKREVFQFEIVKEPCKNVRSALVIAGSDKRGTIYGMFHLSECIGVSPLVDWSKVQPVKRKEVVLDNSCRTISKEPSVKYRGIFVNDEWPAFGNWAERNFGGINAACYEHVFELLLRLKANYFWPAMWRSDFSLDGPGLASAELADELGIVMSTSHHEPCIRSGNEYRHVRGKDSIYGDAWDFRSNREGIIKFWEDGLKRNKDFENVITLGMRGEYDTAIMRNATMEENIELLRDILKVQNKLIKEIINPDIEQVRRQIVFFNEVEKFFYGDENTPGLIGDPELDGVTLMLSDNNYSYTRTLPSAKMANHKGGFGMYYHIDMHGGPHSYEWVGSTYLPRVWEQLSMAYDFGVREIWVVNVGDIGTQEHTISYIMDLAYDIDKMGASNLNSADPNDTNPNITAGFTQEWVRRQFEGAFEQNDLGLIADIIEKYTLMCERRKHEAMNAKVYHPVHFNEAANLLAESEWIIKNCTMLKDKCPRDAYPSFYELIFYPAAATANLMKAWVLATRNEFFAKQNRMEANYLADEISVCIAYDKEITDELHNLDGQRFYGFGMSEHFGFEYWCEEDNKYPLRIYAQPANKPRMIVAKSDSEVYSIGKRWIGKRLRYEDFLRPDIDSFNIDISCGSGEPIRYSITTECPWLSFSKTEGETSMTDIVTVSVDRAKLEGKQEGTFFVNGPEARAFVTVLADNPDFSSYAPMTFIEYDGYVAMEACHYADKGAADEAEFFKLEPYGRTGTAMKVFPSTADFLKAEERPWLAYRFVVNEDGVYDVSFYMAPSSPVDREQNHFIGTQMNDGRVELDNTVWDVVRGYYYSPQWNKEAHDAAKVFRKKFTCKKGVNVLRFYHVSPNICLERIVVQAEGTEIPESYLGPKESYYTV